MEIWKQGGQVETKQQVTILATVLGTQRHSTSLDHEWAGSCGWLALRRTKVDRFYSSTLAWIPYRVKFHWFTEIMFYFQMPVWLSAALFVVRGKPVPLTAAWQPLEANCGRGQSWFFH